MFALYTPIRSRGDVSVRAQPALQAAWPCRNEGDAAEGVTLGIIISRNLRIKFLLPGVY